MLIQSATLRQKLESGMTRRDIARIQSTVNRKQLVDGGMKLPARRTAPARPFGRAAL
jgi:hypothetical protein